MLQEGQSALKMLADELKGKESGADYVEKMSREMAELVMAEDKRAQAEVEVRRSLVLYGFDRAHVFVLCALLHLYFAELQNDFWKYVYSSDEMTKSLQC